MNRNYLKTWLLPEDKESLQNWFIRNLYLILFYIDRHRNDYYYFDHKPQVLHDMTTYGHIGKWTDCTYINGKYLAMFKVKVAGYLLSGQKQETPYKWTLTFTKIKRSLKTA